MRFDMVQRLRERVPRALSVSVIVASGLLLGGCQGSPPPAGVAWYRGSVSVEPGATEVFGPPGEVAIEWRQEPATGLWLWREYRAGGWHVDTVWQVGPGAQETGQFTAGDSTGTWKGTVTLVDWQGTGIWAPAGWRYALSLSNGSGAIDGHADTQGGGPNDDVAGGNDPSDMLLIWIHQRWVRPDGSVAGTMKQTLSQINAEEFREAVLRLGSTP